MDIVYRFDPFAPIENRSPKNHKEAMKRLERGNDRFSALVEHVQSIGKGENNFPPKIVPINPIQLGVPFVRGVEPAHAPFALVIGCSDARVPVEQIVDCAANDLFIVRVAGNVLGVEGLGSVDYAVTVLKNSLKSVVVLGHTNCGAVGAAVDVYLSPSNFSEIAFSHPVRTLVDRILLSVRKAARGLESVVGTRVQKDKRYRDWLSTTACYLNAAVTACDVQREIEKINHRLSVCYSVYDMAWSRLSTLPILYHEQADSDHRFASAPNTPAEFEKLSESIIHRIINQ
jgi:carbonic anhydrase